MLAVFGFCSGSEAVISFYENEIHTTKHLVHERLGYLSWISASYKSMMDYDSAQNDVIWCTVQFTEQGNTKP